MWHDVKLLNATTNALIALVLLVLLASGLWWVAQRPMFTLKTIRVEGMADTPLRRVNSLTIRASAVPRIKGNFFTADLDAVRAAFESVPWVRKAMVRREWPNKLIVTVEEHRALGTWGDDGRLLSVKGMSSPPIWPKPKTTANCWSSKDRTAARRKWWHGLRNFVTGLRRSG